MLTTTLKPFSNVKSLQPGSRFEKSMPWVIVHPKVDSSLG
jgi:hypothetical protein